MLLGVLVVVVGLVVGPLVVGTLEVGLDPEVGADEVGVGAGRVTCSTADLLTHRWSSWEELNFAHSKCSGQVMFLSRRKSSQPVRALWHVSRHGVAMYLRGRPGRHCGK